MGELAQNSIGVGTRALCLTVTLEKAIQGLDLNIRTILCEAEANGN